MTDAAAIIQKHKREAAIDEAVRRMWSATAPISLNRIVIRSMAVRGTTVFPLYWDAVVERVRYEYNRIMCS